MGDVRQLRRAAGQPVQQHHPAAALAAEKNPAVDRRNGSVRAQARPLNCHFQLCERLKSSRLYGRVTLPQMQ
jgi:hypothetical protein